MLAAGQIGDALHAVLCAAGYNLRWLLRAMGSVGPDGSFIAPALSVDAGNHSAQRFALDDLSGILRFGGYRRRESEMNFAGPTK